MESGLLSLKWKNHRNTFFDVLYKIRRNGYYCDTTIACDGKFYKVNKIVLSTCSEYLHQMLESVTMGSSSNSHPIIVLKDIRHQHLEALLDYMYIGEVNVLQSELACIIKAAEYLQIKGLAVPDDSTTQYENREKREHETGNEKDFTKRKKIWGQDEQIEEKNIELPGKGNDSIDNLIDICDSDSFEHRPYDDKLQNNENRDSNHQGLNYNSSSNKQSSVARYTENEEMNQDAINHSNYINNHETLIKEEKVDNSLHLHLDENSYSPDCSYSKTLPENPHTSENEDIPKEIMLEQVQTLEGFSKNTTCNLRSQEIDFRNMQNSPENLIINYTEDQTIHKQFNVLDNGAEFWPHLSQTTTQGVSCPYCLKLYYRKDAFLYHYKTHMGNKPYCCPYCNQSFIQKGSLKNHIKTHTGEKPFECPHCQRRFVQKTHLDNHVKIHTGEKPFPCPMCPKRFIQKVHMENHILTHTGEKPLSCPYCSHRFARKDILKDHISRRHPGHNL